MFYITQEYLNAGSPLLTEDQAWELAGSNLFRVRAHLAESKRCPAHVIEILAMDSNPDVRVAVGLNPATPSPILRRLIADESTDVRYALASNHSMPIQLLGALATDQNPYVSSRANHSIMDLCATEFVDSGQISVRGA
jgi:hypothetical protein